MSRIAARSSNGQRAPARAPRRCAASIAACGVGLRGVLQHAEHVLVVVRLHDLDLGAAARLACGRRCGRAGRAGGAPAARAPARSASRSGLPGRVGQVRLVDGSRRVGDGVHAAMLSDEPGALKSRSRSATASDEQVARSPGWRTSRGRSSGSASGSRPGRRRGRRARRRRRRSGDRRRRASASRPASATTTTTRRRSPGVELGGQHGRRTCRGRHQRGVLRAPRTSSARPRTTSSPTAGDAAARARSRPGRSSVVGR